jgi:hypothetical protein
MSKAQLSAEWHAKAVRHDFWKLGTEEIGIRSERYNWENTQDKPHRGHFLFPNKLQTRQYPSRIGVFASHSVVCLESRC